MFYDKKMNFHIILSNLHIGKNPLMSIIPTKLQQNFNKIIVHFAFTQCDVNIHERHNLHLKYSNLIIAWSLSICFTLIHTNSNLYVCIYIIAIYSTTIIMQDQLMLRTVHQTSALKQKFWQGLVKFRQPLAHISSKIHSIFSKELTHYRQTLCFMYLLILLSCLKSVIPSYLT